MPNIKHNLGRVTANTPTLPSASNKNTFREHPVAKTGVSKQVFFGGGQTLDFINIFKPQFPHCNRKNEPLGRKLGGLRKKGEELSKVYL